MSWFSSTWSFGWFRRGVLRLLVVVRMVVHVVTLCWRGFVIDNVDMCDMCMGLKSRNVPKAMTGTVQPGRR